MKRFLLPLLASAFFLGVGGAVAQAPPSPVVVAAGDISPEGIGGQKATSSLVLRIDPSHVLTLGDNQYEDGALSKFQRYYDPTWGRFKGKTFPSPGNHDPFSSGYRSYFGNRAPRAYRAFTIGAWKALQLDSNASMSSGSAQYAFVRDRLAQWKAEGVACVVAYWHHPRFSSGKHGNNSHSAPIWNLLFAARADLVLNGHDHTYERFAPQMPGGRASSFGVREFVSGLGGKSRYPFTNVKPNSQRRYNAKFGVLRLVLHPTSYSWRFITTDNVVRDQGTSNCV